MEVEMDRWIAFLDSLILRDETSLLCKNWHVKSTASGRMPNYLSNHALSPKISTITNVLYKAYKLRRKKKETLNPTACWRFTQSTKFAKYFYKTVGLPQVLVLI